MSQDDPMKIDDWYFVYGTRNKVWNWWEEAGAIHRIGSTDVNRPAVDTNVCPHCGKALVKK